MSMNSKSKAWWRELLVPVIAVLVGLAIGGAVFMLFTGANPLMPIAHCSAVASVRR